MSKLLERIKNFWDYHKEKIIFFLVIFLIASVSFGLGRLTAIENQKTPIIIEKYLEQ